MTSSLSGHTRCDKAIRHSKNLSQITANQKSLWTASTLLYHTRNKKDKYIIQWIKLTLFKITSVNDSDTGAMLLESHSKCVQGYEHNRRFYLSVIAVLTGCLCLFISRDCLAFCTEPVFASLANVLGQWDNLPSPVPIDIKEYKLYDVETKYGLLQVRVSYTHKKSRFNSNRFMCTWV